VPDDVAELRAANARRRALLAEREAEIAVLPEQLGEMEGLRAEAAELRERATGLSRGSRTWPPGSGRTRRTARGHRVQLVWLAQVAACRTVEARYAHLLGARLANV